MAEENPFVTISVLPETRDELRYLKIEQDVPTYDDMLHSKFDMEVST